MGRLALVTAVLAACAIPGLATAQDQLSLICSGDVTGMMPTGTAAASASDAYGGSAEATGVQQSMVTRTMVIDFEMAAGAAKVRIPIEMRPDFSSSKDGWFPATNLAVTDRLIAGDVKLSFLRSTHFEIDRATGVFSTKHGFRAQCEKVGVTQRKF